MGDFMAPHRTTESSEKYNHFRQRVDRYNQHGQAKLVKYEEVLSHTEEQQREDTKLYHQRWIDSRAKKVAKSKLGSGGLGAPVSRAAVVNGQTNGLTTTLTNGQAKAKAKLNGQSQQNTASSTGNGVGSGVNSNNGSSMAVNAPLMSVNINVDTNLNRCQSGGEIKVTFSSTVNTRLDGGGSTGVGRGGGGGGVRDNKTQQNGGCGGGGDMSSKHTQQTSNCTEDNSYPEPFNSSDLDFQELFENYSPCPGDANLIDGADLALFDENFGGCGSESGDVKDPTLNNIALSCSGPSVVAAPPAYKASGSLPNMTPTPYETEYLMFPPLAGEFPVTPMTCSPPDSVSTSHTPTIMADTAGGPAAETLKQMAAQHQSLEMARYAKTGSAFGSTGGEQFHGSYMGYGSRPMYAAMQRNMNLYGAAAYDGPPVNAGIMPDGMRVGAVGYVPQAATMHSGHPTIGGVRAGDIGNAGGGPAVDGLSMYCGSKQSSIYPGPPAASEAPVSASSIQQLENQVQTHFSTVLGPPGSQPQLTSQQQSDEQQRRNISVQQRLHQQQLLQQQGMQQQQQHNMQSMMQQQQMMMFQQQQQQQQRRISLPQKRTHYQMSQSQQMTVRAVGSEISISQQQTMDGFGVGSAMRSASATGGGPAANIHERAQNQEHMENVQQLSNEQRLQLQQQHLLQQQKQQQYMYMMQERHRMQQAAGCGPAMSDGPGGSSRVMRDQGMIPRMAGQRGMGGPSVGGGPMSGTGLGYQSSQAGIVSMQQQQSMLLSKQQLSNNLYQDHGASITTGGQVGQQKLPCYASIQNPEGAQQRQPMFGDTVYRTDQMDGSHSNAYANFTMQQGSGDIARPANINIRSGTAPGGPLPSDQRWPPSLASDPRNSMDCNGSIHYGNYGMSRLNCESQRGDAVAGSLGWGSGGVEQQNISRTPHVMDPSMASATSIQMSQSQTMQAAGYLMNGSGPGPNSRGEYMQHMVPPTQQQQKQQNFF